jgi:hypothetical protein
MSLTDTATKLAVGLPPVQPKPTYPEVHPIA